jgi:hypothetical protein
MKYTFNENLFMKKKKKAKTLIEKEVYFKGTTKKSKVIGPSGNGRIHRRGYTSPGNK